MTCIVLFTFRKVVIIFREVADGERWPLVEVPLYMLIILYIISVSKYRSKRKKERKKERNLKLSCYDRRKNRPAYDIYLYASLTKIFMKSEADCR